VPERRLRQGGRPADHADGPDRTSTFPERFTSAGYDLTNVSGGADPVIQRAFGYFGTFVSVSQRVINESAVVAATLSAP
jgi:hypothetical protein